MAWVKLIDDYENHKAGQVVDLPAVVARGLIHQGKAKGGRVFENATVSYEKSEEPSVRVINPKPINGRVSDIKKWLDKEGVEYPSIARKPELLKILKNA
jgi:hypothetical protein